MTNRCRFDFSGTEVLVTGGTSGIGFATASAFADSGATVTVTGTRPSTSDYDTSLERFGYHQLDLRDAHAVDDLAASIRSLDVLVNNAGANFPDGKDEWDPDGFSAALDLNVGGAMRLTVRCRAALAASAISGGASVTNIVSMTAFRSTTIVPGYSAAKAALLALDSKSGRPLGRGRYPGQRRGTGPDRHADDRPDEGVRGDGRRRAVQGRHPTHGQCGGGGGSRALPCQ